MKEIFKEFKPSSWAINNRTSIYIFTIIIALWGYSTYNSLPKENFPVIVIPKIFISTVYPGTSPENMENLVTKPLEKRMKSIAGVKKVTSNSYQDYSNVIIEFNTDVKINIAKQKVKDAVDRAKADLPIDLPADPNVMDINLSEIPIMFVNVSGDFDLNKIKNYADKLQDRIESLKEITRVDLIGALEREIQVNVDMYKAQVAQISLGDIERAIGYENMTITGGTVKMDGMRRTINVKKEFKNVTELENLIVKSPNGAPIYLKDIAQIKDTFKEQESFARLGGKNVITLSVVKRAGFNLIEASDKIKIIVKEMQESDFPKGLNVVVTGDQSNQTRTTLHDLINTIVIGFILVTIILMFFMGATNAIFVAMSVPLSMFIAFLIMPSIGFTMNMIVLFGLLLALGIVVDDAIVVIENTHRLFANGKRSIVEAAKMAAGEVFLPVLSGTLTTLAPFIPLAFWDGVIGQFMFFLPVTLIITLLASLFVAYIINPVFAASFMKPEVEHETGKSKLTRGVKITSAVLLGFAILFYVGGNFGFANFLVMMFLLNMLYRFVLLGWVKKFQQKIWPAVIDRYSKILAWALTKPYSTLSITFGLFVLSIILTMARGKAPTFFPSSDPNFAFVYVSLPVGTDPAYTDSVLKIVEKRVSTVLYPDGKENPVVSSVISNVTIAVTDPSDEDQGQYPNRGKLQISFVPFAERNGISTMPYLAEIRDAVKGIAGADIAVTQEQAGPPQPKAITVEISGDDLVAMNITSKQVKRYLDSLHIEGVEELRSDFEDNKPEIVFDIDRERANREGISVGQIGSEIRNAVFGQLRTSKFRDLDDEYPIQIRYDEKQRNNIDQLKNMTIVYRDMAMNGMIRQVPISSFADIRYENTFGGIKRKNQKRVITLSSNVLVQGTENEVALKVQKEVEKFHAPDGVEVKMVGSQEEQIETMNFLGGALLTSIGLIIVILVMQFNSVSKPFIILTEIFFSIIGVLLGTAIFNMDMSIVMTGIGIVALAGIVVRNGILLVEFTDLMLAQGMSARDAIMEAGRTRMTPVILTASATILGLIPLAVGLNIDFVKLFTHLNPEIFFGGDSVAFWGPLSWTMIFGLGFATFLTLILVPAMYMISYRLKGQSVKILDHLHLPHLLMYVPFFILICKIFVGKNIYREAY
ncbi:MAG: efflux RND transporter permease subunit [Bacteroidetes bacterium]|nr:efflux RND transporter permease subunit [Bacteroidota bacterium]